MAIAVAGGWGVAPEVRTHSGQIVPVTWGMEVVALDGAPIGYLKAVESAAILVDRPLRRDIYVPFDAIQRVLSGAIVLTIPADQVDVMKWPHPALLREHSAS